MGQCNKPIPANTRTSLLLLDQLTEVGDGQQALEALVDLIHPVGRDDCETIPTTRTATATLMRVVADNLREKIDAAQQLSRQMHEQLFAKDTHPTRD